VKTEFKIGAHFDLLNKDELDHVLEKQTAQLLAYARGVKHLGFTAQGTIAAGAVTIPSPNPAVTLASLQMPIMGPTDGFVWAVQRVTIDGLSKTVGTVATPAVPASTVVQQNTYGFPVNALIVGGTVTVVTVNGIQVGSGDGTYVIPVGGTIAITYSVAPTWLWSGAAGVVNTDSVQVYRNNVAGYNRLYSLSASQEWETPGGHANILRGGDQLIAAGSGLNSTGTLTLSGEAIEVPAEMISKLVL
jgi:hypothetical protein